MFHQRLSTILWCTRCIPSMFVWLNYVFVLLIIKNRKKSKMATLPNSHQLLKSTRILNLFMISNWREWFTTPKTWQVRIWSVFSVINISFSVNLFFKIRPNWPDITQNWHVFHFLILQGAHEIYFKLWLMFLCALSLH